MAFSPLKPSFLGAPHFQTHPKFWTIVGFEKPGPANQMKVKVLEKEGHIIDQMSKPGRGGFFFGAVNRPKKSGRSIQLRLM